MTNMKRREALARLGGGIANNLVLCMWDARGGKGKSTLLRAVNTVWGHPKNLTCTKTDTLSARYQTLGVRRNLPMCMDEVTNMAEEDMSTLLYDLANGLEKRKSASSGVNLADTGQWETATMLTSNRSVHELLRSRSAQTTAETMRVVEVECQFKNYSGTPLAEYVEDCSDLMDANHGLAGRVFVDWCLKHPERLEEMAERVGALDGAWRASPEERFWTRGLAVVVEAGKLAVELGLLDYDMKALERWIAEELLPSNRASAFKSLVDGEALLADFLNEHMSSTLAVKSEERSVKEGSIIDDYVLRFPSRSLQVRLEADTRTWYVTARVLEEWCGRRRLSVAQLIRDAPGLDGSRVKRNLARHVRALGGNSVICYRFAGGDALDDTLERFTAKPPWTRPDKED